jgi:hypothetical protein
MEDPSSGSEQVENFIAAANATRDSVRTNFHPPHSRAVLEIAVHMRAREDSRIQARSEEGSVKFNDITRDATDRLKAEDVVAKSNREIQ